MSNLQGKRLLFLGGAVQCCKVVEAAKRLGVYTIVTLKPAARCAKLLMKYFRIA